MVWVGRDPKNHVPLDQVAQSPIQHGLEYFQGWDIYIVSGNLFQCLTILMVQLPCSSRPSRTGCQGMFCICKVGSSITSLGNLFQCSVTLTVKQCFPMFRWNLLCFSLCPLPLVLSLDTTKKRLASYSLCPPFRYLYKLIRFCCLFSSPHKAVPTLSASPCITDAVDP